MEIEDRRKVLMGRARARSTGSRYAKWWTEFQEFCRQTDRKDFPANSETVEDFITWLELCGRGASVDVAAAAVRAKHLDEGEVDPCNTHAIKMLRTGIRRILAEEGEEKEVREPFPVRALRCWTRRRPEGISNWRWRRDAAMVAIGLRCMRRPGELTALRRKDARVKDGRLWIFVRKSKTDQFGKGKLIPVDEGASSDSCPVRLLKKWVELAELNPEAPLFPNANSGKFGSTAMVTASVKKMAEIAGEKGKFSGHSLRIGGATAAMSGGMSLAMIRSIGGWESPAVLTYLRSIGAASAKASWIMGM